ncbi:winged helix-turn-helix transcriptional regulator [Clostridium acetobutylicum]|uniref:Transcriptional regulator HTH-type, ArsR family n=2 Tax=Clostridiaceae TaxID=31979 RepID=Q97TJ8_CLOAB|nr:Transcriptional regulator HTH-type, ArsR family [Clostridium acetobutylicum ATCC 824]AEI34844.1 ArsR family transcriptional regulator [Clostridium acetobutylicum DSM 1731]AWV82390.1 ArsR family transcriptional regulator [Clostridium acetobutylicum]PSM04426.1 ArsR family transcriptional regulator [Clostridium sp. NJ4]MBC2395766.1 winged helix-turn-helix transcriptional regulator [Clostridium acetobutylicum]
MIIIEYIHIRSDEMNLIQVIKALSDETRMRILNLLEKGEMCVCEMEEILDISQSNASRHLTKLTNAEIINYNKVSKYVYYKINEDVIETFPFIEEIIKKHALNLEQCKKDLRQLKKYKESGLNCDELKETKLGGK